MNYRTCKTVLILASLLFVGCNTLQRPNALICGINGASHELRCYDLHDDFDDNGALKKTAQPKIQAVQDLTQLNAGIYLSPTDFKKVKLYLTDLKKAYEAKCK
jgi:hypothetical protein